jgi:O-antigen/teichoic acid export membrane protein
LQVLSAGLPMAFIGAVLWRALAARDQQDMVLVSRLVSLVIRLGGGFLLIYLLSLTGAALSATTNLVISMLLFAVFLHRDGISLKLVNNGWRFTLAAIGMGLATWLLSNTLSIWFLVPFAALLYGILIVAFRAFSPDDYTIFRSIWQPRLSENHLGVPK